MLKVNIKGGTRGGLKFLCKTCGNCTWTQGESESEEFIRCHETNRNINYKVVVCNSYRSVADPDLKIMNQTAWIIETRKGRVVGFVSPEEYRKKHDSGPDYDIPNLR